MNAVSEKTLTFIWDVTHNCPLQCLYCYSESGPGKGKKIRTDELRRLGASIARECPDKVLFSGGEPALVPGINDVARSLREAGIMVELYTSGFSLDARRIDAIVDSFHVVHISLDDLRPEVNDRIRGRGGAHANATMALDLLNERALVRRAAGVALPKFGIDCTLLRENRENLEAFVEAAPRRWPALDFFVVNVAIPSGRGSEESCVRSELLGASDIEKLRTKDVAHLRKLLPDGIVFEVMDNSELRESEEDPSHLVVQVEPDGGVRALKICKRVAGNLNDEPLTAILARAAQWRRSSGLVRALQTAPTIENWAQAVRAIDGERPGAPLPQMAVRA